MTSHKEQDSRILIIDDEAPVVFLFGELIMVTATTEDSVCRKAMRLAAYSWLTKPVDLAVLQRLVALAVGRRHRYAVGGIAPTGCHTAR